MLVFYTDENAYNAALAGATDTLFTIPDSLGTTSFSSASGYTQSGVNFVGTTNTGYYLSATAAGYYGDDYEVESLQTPAPGSYFGNATGATAITVPTGTTAFGIRTFDVLSGDTSGGYTTDFTLTVTNSGGDSATGTGTTATGAGYTSSSTSGFLGVISTTPITSMALNGTASNNFVDIVQVDIACFCTGTLIATEHGQTPVEALQVGQSVLTASGEHARIKWIGHRRVDLARHPKPQEVAPVRVHPGAFGDGAPSRDLWLSPDHAVYMDGVLIPVRHLVNDATIRREPCASATYWHVELERHDVLLAEGLPCESYLDTGNRSAFADGGPAVQLHPDFARGRWDAYACAALVLDGPRLQAARQALRARAEALGHRLTRDPALRIRVDGEERVAYLRDGWHVVTLPAGTGRIEIISRSGIPAATGDRSTDPRRLGVAITRVKLDNALLPLEGALGRGWHAIDSNQADWLWTDGAAELNVPHGGLLAIEVAMTECYWHEAPSRMRPHAA